jgi:hypothetical protein
MVTAAGVASAKLLTEESHTAAPAPAVVRYTPPVAEAATAPVPPPVVAPPVVTPIAQEQKKAPAPQKVSVDVRQAPVPLQLRSRATANAKQPTIDALIATQSVDAKDVAKDDKSTDEATADPAVATDDGFNEARAKAAIEADGYKGVTALRKGDRGVWHAKALRGRTEVMLTVDASGSVAAD